MDKKIKTRTAFGKRMFDARKASGLTQQVVCKEIGIRQSTLSELETDANGSSYTPMFAKLYNKDPIWLAEGIGGSGSNLIAGPDIKGQVPLISWVKAGSFCDAEDFLEPGDAKEWLLCPVRHGPKTYALEVSGSSMDSGDFDGYPEGFHIYVDPDIEPTHGDDVVVRTPEGKATFKRLQINAEGSFLLALNPNWPERIIKVPEGTVFCGVVIYSGRKRSHKKF